MNTTITTITLAPQGGLYDPLFWWAILGLFIGGILISVLSASAAERWAPGYHWGEYGAWSIPYWMGALMAISSFVFAVLGVVAYPDLKEGNLADRQEDALSAIGYVVEPGDGSFLGYDADGRYIIGHLEDVNSGVIFDVVLDDSP